MGKINKGRIASISGNIVRVVPSDYNSKTTARITTLWLLRGEAGDLKKGTEVIYFEADDSTGLILARADGEGSFPGGGSGGGGADGEDGITPHIGANGNWYIGTTDTGVKAAGEDGQDGAPGKDGSPGKDGNPGQDGAPGEDGITPHIGANGNWYIGTTDTGVKAAGEDGQDGAPGTDGKTPVKGTDYFTDSDKAEMVDLVLAALPTWTGGSY